MLKKSNKRMQKNKIVKARIMGSDGLNYANVQETLLCPECNSEEITRINKDEFECNNCKMTCNFKELIKKGSKTIKVETDDEKPFPPAQKIREETGKIVPYSEFFFMSILTIACTALAWLFFYRVIYDLGEIIFPVVKYPYWVQFLFTILLIIVLFSILMVILYRVYKKKGKYIEHIADGSNSKNKLMIIYVRLYLIGLILMVISYICYALTFNYIALAGILCVLIGTIVWGMEKGAFQK